ncbi:class I SAM-dependent methyltransferase [Jiangella rhizosphaerae]|uniref:Class I SAM-dependent methyltransferase n=1 Tax=Jiangella rhizosphaerae TaxID=2293569 RepID=A0A418KNZ6_9ACTN|nr:class I SAM-dependent methyltransferase [Jiangella rhizosphaerae]RIQ20885.1 class I SAM-dependent methyltransferase [Jiangella rhizosphaerae]
MHRAIRALLGSRWPLLGMAGAVAAVVVAVVIVATGGSLAEAALALLLGLTLVGLVVVGASAREAEQRARKTEKQLKTLGDSIQAVATSVQAVEARQNDPSGGPLAAIIGAQRLDAAVRHDELVALHHELRADLHATLTEGQLAELSALANLYAMLGADDEVPAFGGFAASPRTVLRLASLVRRLPSDALIVECGSGSSTVWLALACRRAGKGRVVALEHHELYAGRTREALARHGLEDVAEVRVAPLEPVTVGGEKHDWYAAPQWTDLRGIDLLFVDGPPGSVGPRSRYPAFPLLATALDDGAIVALDDAQRQDEADIAADWLAETVDGVRLADDEVVGRTRFFIASRA